MSYPGYSSIFIISFLILKYENKEIGSKRTPSLSSLVKYPSFRPESKFSIMFFSTFIKSRDNTGKFGPFKHFNKVN